MGLYVRKLARTDLNGGAVTLKPNNLPNQVVRSHSNQLVHGCSPHVVGNDNRPRHLAYIPTKSTPRRNQADACCMHSCIERPYVALVAYNIHVSQNQTHPAFFSDVLGSLAIAPRLLRSKTHRSLQLYCQQYAPCIANAIT